MLLQHGQREGGSDAVGGLSTLPSIAIVRWIFMRISSIDGSAATLASDIALLNWLIVALEKKLICSKYLSISLQLPNERRQDRALARFATLMRRHDETCPAAGDTVDSQRADPRCYFCYSISKLSRKCWFTYSA
jgi:hypothetical protein